ncbi:uncharacterized protein LOC114805295 [Zeugodacus cucurbitae]|uniref:uncharacterized protein LOC114805295 n=1 Tax=Zeugodacus cucurbitae TaxID=28588 RepID=UPI0023D91DFD|nr:uncharacterized protein LOC114805295 [Zeugodacus cucurbitae]
MFKGDRFVAIVIVLVFCAKTFFMSFFALNQYPRSYYLKVQISAYAEPTTYLWFTFISNLTAFMAGFFLFAGLCENLYSFFLPAFAVIVCYIVGDLFLHCLFVFITTEFHLLMIVNFCCTIVFAGCMYFIHRCSKDFYQLSPTQEMPRTTSVSN